MTGQIIAHYQILEKLGQGGMSIVYKAKDLRLNRLVALKFLSACLSNEATEKARFLREARMAAALDHPNIATVYEIVETDDQTFISMAYIEGETLQERLKRERLSVEEAMRLARQIAAGLKEAHRHNIIHRDVKSSNIMINTRGEVKITDFGLAKLRGSSSITKTGTQIGTAAYMSPEVIQGHMADPRSDIFSFGVVLYEMLTGELPFTGENDQAVMFAIVYEEPRPLRQLRPEIPQALEQIVLRMLRKDPDARYQSVEEVEQELQRFQRGEATTASLSHPVSSPGFGAKSARGLALPGVLILLAMVLVALGAFLWLRSTEEKFPFKERDWILVTDFDNQTGEAIFDQALDKALMISIGQSRYVNVFPRDRIRNALRRMKREEVSRIDATIGREIALREGIAALLVPTITRLGQRYTLTAEVLDPATGEMLTSEIVHADSREKVLDALDELTRRIRRHLGEAMAAISRRSRPLKHVTTASLEALKYYSVADEHLRRAEYEEARRFLESALKADSSFTAAKAVLGRMHFELSEYVEGFDREVGKRLLAEAVKDVDNLTDQEKYGILAWYAQAVENDLPRAIQYTKELATLYPDQSHVHNNLAFLYGQMGRYQEAIRECQIAIRLDPYLMIAYNNLSNIYMFQLGSEIDSARVWCLRQIAHNPEHFWAYYHLGWAYLGMDSLKQAQQALEKAYELHNRWKILPRFTWHLSRLGIVYLLQGDYRRSIDFFLKIVEVDPSEPAGYYFAGIAAEMSGDSLSARQYFRQFVREMRQLLRRGPASPKQQIYLALGLIRIGEREQGWKLCQQACARDTTLHFEKARVLAVYGKPQEAIDELEAAVRHGYRNYVWMKIHPDFLSLHRKPRFIALVNRLLKRGQNAS